MKEIGRLAALFLSAPVQDDSLFRDYAVRLIVIRTRPAV